MILGFGCGTYDTGLTTITSHEEEGEGMAVMYSCFGGGAMLAPLIIGAFVDDGIGWNVSALRESL